MDITTALIAYTQAAITIQPSKGSLHNPAVLSQADTFIDAPPPQTMNNASLFQSLAMLVTIVTAVGMQLVRTVAQLTSHSRQMWDGIDHLQEHGDVTHISACVPYDEGDSLSVDHKMALRARFAAICWVRAGFFAPPGAGTLPESMHARDQSICSTVDKRSNKTRCSCSHTPASCQSRRRRQQVIPLPQPSSCGNISQGMPVLSTNRMPVSTARLSTRGRPPLGLGGSAGMSGTMTSHNSSLTKGFAIPRSYQVSRFC